jgi:hypothetical protein
MPDTVPNRGLYRMFAALASVADLRILVILGTATGVNEPDLNTVADLDAVSGVSIHSERLTLTEAASEDDAADRAALDTGNPVFAAASGVTARGVAIYDEGGGTDSTRDLISVHTSGFPLPMDGGLTVNIADLLRAASA